MSNKSNSRYLLYCPLFGLIRGILEAKPEEYAEKLQQQSDSLQAQIDRLSQMQKRLKETQRFYAILPSFRLDKSDFLIIPQGFTGKPQMFKNIMDYLTAAEIANKWKVSSRMAAYYCEAGRIEGAVKKGKTAGFHG